MTRPSGTLFAIGVGPGDPELLTLKAARLLGSVRVVFTAASPKNDQSHALTIAKQHLRPDALVERLEFPMTRDEAVLQSAWRTAATRVLAEIESGNDAAFLTLGDPMTYSTFGYLSRIVREMSPAAKIEAVPGVTSYQAAAAAALTPLVEGEESLMIVSGIADQERLSQVLGLADNAVVLKAYRNLPAIRKAVEGLGLGERAVTVSRLGMDGEARYQGLAQTPETLPYFSLMLLPKPRAK